LVGLVVCDIIKLFESYDKNNDGFLDIFEFEPLGHIVLNSKVNNAREISFLFVCINISFYKKTEHNYSQIVQENDEFLVINAQFSPIERMATIDNEAKEPLVRLFKKSFNKVHIKAIFFSLRNLGKSRDF
jgi:hypothetical protein